MQQINRATRSLPWFARPIIAATIGLIFGIGVPFLLKANEGLAYFTDQQSLNSFAGTIGGILFGRFLSRRLEHFPGVSSGAIVSISFLSSFALVGLLFLFLRLDYSRVIFVSGAAASMLWFIGIYLYRLRFMTLNFSYLPDTDIASKIALPNVKLSKLHHTDDFGAVGGAVIADLRADIPNDWVQFLAECALRGIPVYHVKHVQEHLTGMVQIEHLSENTLGSILPSRAYMGFKRLIDTGFALVCLPFVGVLLLLLAPLLLITQGRPLFYTQPRLGQGGREFTMYKLRTMRNAGNVEPDDEIKAAETQTGDPRITKMGAFLRKSRIDELPQILNVLKGDMSWIGPRPEAAILGTTYEKIVPFYRYRYIVRPGISGWAQISQGHVTDMNDIEHKLQYDFYYIKNISAWLDILIAFRTIKIMAGGFGAK